MRRWVLEVLQNQDADIILQFSELFVKLYEQLGYDFRPDSEVRPPGEMVQALMDTIFPMMEALHLGVKDFQAALVEDPPLPLDDVYKSLEVWHVLSSAHVHYAHILTQKSAAQDSQKTASGSEFTPSQTTNLLTSFGSSFASEEEIVVDSAMTSHLEGIKVALSQKNCTCPAFRRVSRRFDTVEQAELATKLLSSDSYHLVVCQSSGLITAVSNQVIRIPVLSHCWTFSRYQQHAGMTSARAW